MPRNVRNWWIEGRADGARNGVGFGPRAKDDGFELTIYQRDKGSVSKALTIGGRVLSNGTLVLDVDGVNGSIISLKTER